VAAASDELRMECCIISRTGRDHQRKGQTCEDVACAECPLHGSEEALGGTPAALFCVFDGHCGRGAADAASTALPDEVSKRLTGVREQLAAAVGAEDMLRSAFLATDQAISAEEGCTATAVLMWRDGQGDVCLQAANVGDSSAFFIDPATGQARELTEDHRLTNPRERQRLQDMGIQLASNARRLYGLNLCRGLGDKFLKDEDLGLSAEPYVSSVVRLGEQEGGILLIASDGLWDVADQDAVTQAICQADRDKDGNVVETTNAAIAVALKHRTKDDVTALVVRVWPATEWELRSPTKNLDDGEAAAFVVG
jgi:protein phosphatase